jgi:hypothetical protein
LRCLGEAVSLADVDAGDVPADGVEQKRREARGLSLFAGCDGDAHGVGP